MAVIWDGTAPKATEAARHHRPVRPREPPAGDLRRVAEPSATRHQISDGLPKLHSGVRAAPQPETISLAPLVNRDD